MFCRVIYTVQSVQHPKYADVHECGVAVTLAQW